MVAGMVIMFWLDPSEVGKWNTVSIFLAYVPFLQLGIQSGLSIELPVTLGRNEESKARQFIANELRFAILVSVVILLIGMLMTSPLALVLWVLAPWLLGTFFPKYIESMWAMRIMAIAFVFSSSVTTSWVLNTLHAFKYAYVFSLINFVGCFVFPYLMTYLWPEHILTAVTIGLAINNFVCYVVNLILLRIVLFKPQYNSPETN